MQRRLKASISFKRKYVIDLLITLFLLFLLYRLLVLFNTYGLKAFGSISFIYIASAAYVSLLSLLSIFDFPAKTNRKEQSKLNKLNVVVSVPVYNEDPLLLQECLESLIAQSRKPNRIIVVDDGSTQVSYFKTKKYINALSKKRGIKLNWYRTENFGKRHAQYYAFSKARNAEIFITVDSDTQLDRSAIKEGLKPFKNEDVASVAGVVLAKNSNVSILGRMMDNWYVTSQLSNRAGLSATGNVMVNSGALAFYRSDIIFNNIDSYLSETFFGKEVKMSDDSMLTLFANLSGKTVQQSSSIVFTAMPTKINHHIRQYTRWMRGSFIRSWWRIKYLPLNNFGFWYQVYGWAVFYVLLPFSLIIAVTNIDLIFQILLYMLLINIIYSFTHTVRYLQLERSDMSSFNQIINFLMTPLALIWSLAVLRIVKIYAVSTCLQSGWGTRKKVEVVSS